MEADQTAREKPETTDLSCHSEPSVESGEKPDQADVTQLLKPAAIGATSDTRKPRQENGWSGWSDSLDGC